ncbi:MAG: hypothetical protein U5L00_09125 [Desulfovermiculus sp.]|nr:hypothetical protein [Desulfovermiculus sp.]
MPLAKDDFETIAQYIRENLSTWLAEQSLGKPPQVYEIELRERMVRVEEELKNQRAAMQQGFERMDKRFEEMLHYVDKRFEQVDKRFEQVDKRFEQVDKRFEQMDKRFEDLRADTNARFEEINARFDQLNVQMKRFMIWSFGFTATLAGIVIGVIKFT